MIEIVNKLKELIEEKSGEDLVIYDVAEITTVAKYVFVVTANSQVHAESLGNYVIDLLTENDLKSYIMNKNFEPSNPWILIDASDFIFNIFNDEAREFYQLEKLYTRGTVLYKSTDVKYPGHIE